MTARVEAEPGWGELVAMLEVPSPRITLPETEPERARSRARETLPI